MEPHSESVQTSHSRDFLTDTCRICSAPAEPGQPLFHPCKCSGTIRYIHQDWYVLPPLLFQRQTCSDICVWFSLTTWLEHSKKKTCDVCKHQYSFSKGASSSSSITASLTHPSGPIVYAQDMPTHLPVILLFRQFAQQAVHAVIFCLRAVLVAFVWLAVLPWFTVWTWRIYFAMGSSTYDSFDIHLTYVSCSHIYFILVHGGSLLVLGRTNPKTEAT